MIGIVAGRRWCALVGSIGVLINLHPTTAQGQGEPHEYRTVAMGMELRIVAHGEPRRLDRAIEASLSRIDSLEWILSDWRPASELSRLSRHPAGAWIVVSPTLFEVVSLALEVARASQGAFDPTVGPLTSLWREARRTAGSIDARALQAARVRVGWQWVSLDSTTSAIRFERGGMRLDMGGIAKGAILAATRDALASHGITSVLLEAGGDIVTGAPPPGTTGWRVALSALSGDTVVTLSNAALSTSGPAAQWIEDDTGRRRSHVIDPASGQGSTRAITIAVLGRDPATADALATAMTLVPETARAGLERRFRVQAIELRDADGIGP
jgi:thiamine biosynthesis lipoprotein